MVKAVFFDKDGVLNVDKGVEPAKKVELYSETGAVIAHCRKKGYKIIIVTNQPVIARGLLSEKALEENFVQFKQMILAQDVAATIDKIYFCPHHPNATLETYRKKCECRKPKPGMIIRAQNEFNINLKNSYMVGDRPSDIIAGYLAGCKTIQCLTGMHTEKMIESDLKLLANVKPDYAITDISQLKEIIQ